jgi:TPR repeat protein
MKLARTLAAAFLLLGAGNGALAQSADQEVNLCKALLAVLPVMAHPAVDEVVRKPGASIGDLVSRILELASRNVPDAQYAVGLMLQTGDCLEKNLQGALELITLAADGGVDDAQRMLAFNYALGRSAPPEIGLNLPEDVVRGYMWFLIVDDQKTLEQLRKRLSASQLADAEKLAAEWRAKNRK